MKFIDFFFWEFCAKKNSSFFFRKKRLKIMKYWKYSVFFSKIMKFHNFSVFFQFFFEKSMKYWKFHKISQFFSDFSERKVEKKIFKNFGFFFPEKCAKKLWNFAHFPVFFLFFFEKEKPKSKFFDFLEGNSIFDEFSIFSPKKIIKNELSTTIRQWYIQPTKYQFQLHRNVLQRATQGLDTILSQPENREICNFFRKKILLNLMSVISVWRSEESSQTEIGELHASHFVHQQVIWLQILEKLNFKNIIFFWEIIENLALFLSKKKGKSRNFEKFPVFYAFWHIFFWKRRKKLKILIFSYISWFLAHIFFRKERKIRKFFIFYIFQYFMFFSAFFSKKKEKIRKICEISNFSYFLEPFFWKCGKTTKFEKFPKLHVFGAFFSKKKKRSLAGNFWFFFGNYYILLQKFW